MFFDYLGLTKVEDEDIFWLIMKGKFHCCTKRADGLDVNPFYHYWLDILYNTSKVIIANFQTDLKAGR
jgi:hypothetical protein